MSTIISFDPGYSTGVIIANNVDYTQRTYDLIAARIVMFPDRAWLNTLLLHYWRDLERIVIEDFLLFEDKALAQTGSRFEATKVIERITVYAEQLNIADKIKMQAPDLRLNARGMPADHLAFLTSVAPDPKVRRHLIAAYQHLRYYIFWQSNQLKKATKP